MPQNDLVVFLWYLLLANGAALLLTLYDKRAARCGRWRIPESTLLTTAAFGGAFAMLASMLLIRHKTQHKKFMVGLPVILVLQLLAAGLCAVLFRPPGS